MAANPYRFHCTDGTHAVLDRTGKRLRNQDEVFRQAGRVARAVMESCGGRLDWSDWIVDVHDARGRRVMIVAFSDAAQQRQAA